MPAEAAATFGKLSGWLGVFGVYSLICPQGY
jgi:hypothetical protein